jgi:hypothetical protein
MTWQSSKFPVEGRPFNLRGDRTCIAAPKQITFPEDTATALKTKGNRRITYSGDSTSKLLCSDRCTIIRETLEDAWILRHPCVDPGGFARGGSGKLAFPRCLMAEPGGGRSMTKYGPLRYAVLWGASIFSVPDD